ncbi:MAG TPA: hypothetical protein VKA03_06830 [Methylovirgula sp.]|nr:hypothetical protein [Methylovirgula sp.]
MTEKIEIVECLGESAVLLPRLIAAAFAANDRIKLRLTLLQEAAARIQNPQRPAQEFSAERQATGLDDAEFDRLVMGAHALPEGRGVVPGAALLISGLSADLGAMLVPLTIARPETAHQFSERLAELQKHLPAAAGDQIDITAIADMASASRERGDSVHLLVMDLHKELNRLAADTAVETIDGAKAHGVDEADRSRIRAFMRGLNRTAPLACGHPGLATTAVRSGARLTIQNDIGATDAHVLVINVEASSVTITYTDIHRSRTEFFIALFAGKDVAFNPLAERQAQGFERNMFFLLTGRFAAETTVRLEDFLEFLGSRIVFLIDWNKARKALQNFVGNTSAIELLLWAAEHDYGHRAFLELGGTDLVFEAVRHAAAGRIPYGARLDEVLGRNETADFLRNVLRETSRGFSAGCSLRLVRDEIQADLAQRLETAERALLVILVRHLGLSRMLADLLRDALSQEASPPIEARRSLVEQAKKLEAKGDRLTIYARDLAAKLSADAKLRFLIDEIDTVLDCLDEGAFLLSLMPDDSHAAPLGGLAEITTEGVGNLVRAVEATMELPNGRRADAEDALRAIDATVIAEHRADDAERDAMRVLMTAPSDDARQLIATREIAHALEEATDHLSHAALSLRDRVLEELSA